MNSRIMHNIDFEFKSSCESIKAHCAGWGNDCGIFADNYNLLLEYRRKHEWKLWGYLSCLQDILPYTDYELINNMKKYYRNAFKKLWNDIEK